jgi:hypothetical protein
VRRAVGTIDFPADLDLGKPPFALEELKLATVTITR